MEKNTKSEKATLLLYCQDTKGIVLTVSEFIFNNGGNVIDLEQHLDPATETFFMRVHWDLNGFSIPTDKISEYFETLVAEKYKMKWSIELSIKRPKMALFVTKLTHCLYDILGRWKSNDWEIDIPVIISNHKELEPIAEQFGIDFHYLPITKDNKK